MATNEERKEHALDPAININYPPSTSYVVKEDKAYWEAVEKNAAIVRDMRQVQDGQEQERQHMEDVQTAAAVGASEALDRIEREKRRLEGLEKARAAKKPHGKAADTTPEGQ